jgi:hypothetical protein
MSTLRRSWFAYLSAALVLQFLLAVLCADLAQALLHRAYHKLPAGTWPSEDGVMKLQTVPQGFWPQNWSAFRRSRSYENYVGQDQ